MFFEGFLRVWRFEGFRVLLFWFQSVRFKTRLGLEGLRALGFSALGFWGRAWGLGSPEAQNPEPQNLLLCSGASSATAARKQSKPD